MKKLLIFSIIFLLIFLSFLSPLTVSLKFKSKSNNLYYNYAELTDLVEDLQNKFPDIFSYQSIGTTYEGRDIWSVKISDNVSFDEDEAEVLFMGGVHGNEKPGYQAVIYTLKSIVENYTCPNVNNSFTSRIMDIVDNSEIFFIPMVNPDGVEANTRKNKKPNDCILGESLFCGVDVNRNYAYKWYETDNNSFKYVYGHFRINELIRTPLMYVLNNFPAFLLKTTVMNPSLDFLSLLPYYKGGTYRGEYPFSENESRAVKEFVENRSICISADYHIFSGKILYPWSWTEESAEDKDIFLYISENISKINGYNNTQSGLWYYTPGCCSDWMYANHDVIPFIIELWDPTDGLFDLIRKEKLEEMCKTHLLVNLYLAEQAISIYDN